MEYGLDEEVRNEGENVMEEKAVKAPEKRRVPFAYWTVGGKDYKLKLTTATICQLEDKFKTNLLNLLSSYGGLPPLAVMLTVIQGAMKPWEHGIKYTDVQRLFDKYCEEGGTQLTLMTDILMEIYKVSGFFSVDQQVAMDQKLEEAKELI